MPHASPLDLRPAGVARLAAGEALPRVAGERALTQAMVSSRRPDSGAGAGMPSPAPPSGA
jgi:hypothetical protein